jgi:hypothetical protein
MQNTSDVNIQKFSANGTQPVLQSNDAADMDQFRKNEEALLNATPWKEENGNVHLPISRAMEVVMQRNQPSRANAANPSNFDPKLVPTEAGFPAVAAVHQEADASMVEGAPSEETQGEHPSATPEQKLKTPPPSAKAPKN